MNDPVTIEDILRTTRNALIMLRADTLAFFDTYPDEISDADSTMRMLFLYYCDRARAVIQLAEYGLSWDAEIVLRSAYETAAKLLFMVTADDAMRAALAAEYWTDLASAADKRTARKAGWAEAVFAPDDQANRDVFRLLQHPTMIRTGIIAKEEARRLEQKWSFSEIIDKLAVNIPGLANARSLLHIYGMASHLVHADFKAMELMIDRGLRTSSDRRILEDGHTVRMMSDIISLGSFCGYLLGGVWKAEHAKRQTLMRRMNDVIELGAPFSDAFHANEKEFYDRMLRAAGREQS
jgi:Family of unknown function (DUF5677)